jgi:hypothetical protein
VVIRMGYEPSPSAARRLHRVALTTRDAALRSELRSALVIRPSFVSNSLAANEMLSTSAASSATDSRPASTSPLTWTPADAGHESNGIVELCTFTPVVPNADLGSVDSVLEPRFPIDAVLKPLATPELVRSLLDALGEQARALALVREAHALGAAVLPAEVLAVVLAAAAVIPTALQGTSHLS